MDKTNSKKKIIIIASIVVVLILALILAIAIKRAQNKGPEEPPTPTNIKLDDETKKKMSNFIGDLSTGSYCELSSTKEFTNDCIYRNPKTVRANLTETYRVYSLILAIGTRKENNIMVGNIIVEGKSMNNPYYVNLIDVEKEYKLLYGSEESFDPNIINTITKENIKYDANKEKFLYQEPEATAFVKTYIEDYDSTPEEAYVYVRVGYITYEMYKYHLFNNRNKTKEIASLTTREYKEGKIINESNYTELQKYKVTFMKEENTDNLVFKSIELVS